MTSKAMKYIHQLKLFNRRLHKRFTPSHNIKCICIYTESDRRIEIPAEIINVSEGGLRLFTGGDKVYPKTLLEIIVELPSHQKTLSLHGEVIRTYRRYHQYHLYYSAVGFEGRDEEGVRFLLEHISEI